ncbi:MAG TPA: hypothetical protein PLW44_15205 [Chitinophagales bacterium]|nr:hypothetical protein [Chitinophagales bacterium]
MKTMLLFFAIAISACCNSQNITVQCQQADSLLQVQNFSAAYKIIKQVALSNINDTLYPDALWYYVAAATMLEKEQRLNEKWDSALIYAMEVLAAIEKGENYFKDKFAIRKYWMYKNIIVSYFGLRDLNNAKKYQQKLYAGYKNKTLPVGLDQYYNFEFFKWQGKNVWGYEYYPQLGDPETEGSFSKIVYYIYSTKEDGTDKDQLYRLHVLKFHKFDNSTKFDYVLTKRLDAATEEVSGTFYSYTYNKQIDYQKLMADIREVLNGNYNPSTQSTIKKSK